MGIDDFLGSPATRHRTGSYHKQPATLSFNPETGRCVVLKPNGEFWTTWKLSYDQLQHVIRTGKLGGG